MAQQYIAVDFAQLDEVLSEDERLVRDSVRQFVDNDVMPIIAECNRQGRFPRELVPKMGELGLLGSNLEGYECAGMGAVAYGLIMQELERGDSGIRSFASVQGALCMYPIHAFGSEEQKQRFLPSMARGERIGCFGLTEADFGSNPAGMATRAVREGDSWTLNGSKMWITNGGIADVAVIWAQTPEGIRGFLVDCKSPGFTARDIEGKFSLRASVTSELFFDNVKVPDSDRLPEAEGLIAPLRCLNQARYGIGWGALGAASAIYDESLRYAKSRIQFDKPIAAFQLVQRKLVWMLTEITKGQLLMHRLGLLKQEGRLHHTHISMAKMNNVDVARQCAILGREILGANGIHDEYQVGRHLCNIESVYTYEGTHDIHTLILGEHITGHAAFK